MAVSRVVAVFGHFRQSSARLEFANMTDILVDLIHDGGRYKTVLDGTREKIGGCSSGQTRL